MKRISSRAVLILVVCVGLLDGCAIASPLPTPPTASPPTEMPTASSVAVDTCLQSGTYHSAQIALDSAEPLYFNYYLPPCYEQQGDSRYPVLYLLHGAGGSEYTWNSGSRLEQTANDLIHGGRIPPLIVVMPRHLDNDQDHDGDLFVQYLIPYVDANLRTRPVSRYRVLGGASYGGMMSIRMAFKNPGLFSRVGIFGHGLSPRDAERLAVWIDNTPPEQWPQVLVDIAFHDPGMEYGQRVIEQLEDKHVPYLLLRGEDRHSYDYWFGHLSFYLDWFATDWLTSE